MALLELAKIPGYNFVYKTENKSVVVRLEPTSKKSSVLQLEETLTK